MEATADNEELKPPELSPIYLRAPYATQCEYLKSAKTCSTRLPGDMYDEEGKMERGRRETGGNLEQGSDKLDNTSKVQFHPRQLG